jgi:hypothetical protein
VYGLKILVAGDQAEKREIGETLALPGNPSAQYGAADGRERGGLGDQLLNDCASERIEILRHQHERARTADDIFLIIFVQAAGRVGVLGIPGHRPVAQDQKSINDNAFGNRLVTRQLDIASGIVGAVAGYIEREVPPRLANVGYSGVKRKKYAQDEFFAF